ncbi:hypothetical protein [Sphingobium yanoikuyae]|uniref:hypothetical protein n=1 Tax=Sphingobium yanoikuyae TaxID=13690 RepID=UPI0035C7801C
MIIFENPGLIDKDAISIVGISAKLPDSIGRFGTGIKYAFATILREGGEIVVYRGKEAIKIGTRKRNIREQDFAIVTMNGKNTGFATHMGRDWKPWMVLRELASNAMDEGGDYRQAESFDADAETADDKTIITVEWPDLEAAYRNRGELFIDGDVILKTDAVLIYDKRVRYLYYRGIRAHELPGGQAAAFAYDLRGYQHLTEDRTMLWPDNAKPPIAKAFLRCEDEAILRRVLFGNDGYEAHLDFDQHDENYEPIQPTRAFIDMCIEAREAGKLRNESAKKLLMKYLREQEADTTRSGRMNSHPVVDWLVGAAESLGFDIDEEKLKIVLVPELPGTATTLFEKGRIYILRDLVGEGQSRIGLLEQFLLRLTEAEIQYASFEHGMKFILPKLIATKPSLRELIDAEKAKAEEPFKEPADEVIF